MPLDTNKSSNLSRITFGLELFDERVITLMAKRRKQSRSETVRNLIHNWIESNPSILKCNYDIDLNGIAREINTIDHTQVIQNSFQQLVNYSITNKSSELSRITFSIDTFDKRVLTLMAKKRRQSRSEMVRNLVHKWIENNPDILKSDYDIDLNDLAREIDIKNYDHFIQATIQKLVEYSEFFNEIEIDILVEQLEISRKILRDIIIKYHAKLEKNGIKLRIKGKLIIKEK